MKLILLKKSHMENVDAIIIIVTLCNLKILNILKTRIILTIPINFFIKFPI